LVAIIPFTYKKGTKTVFSTIRETVVLRIVAFFLETMAFHNYQIRHEEENVIGIKKRMKFIFLHPHY